MVAKKDLTDRTLKALKPAELGKRYVRWDAAVPGLGIRVSDRSLPEKIGAFVLVTRYPGSKNPVARALGEYPAMTLTDARDKAREWREDIRRGIDPALKEEQLRRSRQDQAADTFELLFTQYADRQLSKLRTGKVVEQVVRRAVIPLWGAWPVADIRRRHVIDLVDDLAAKTPINANRILAYLKTFFRWCVDRDRLDASPADAVKRPSRETKRDRVLSDDELAIFWRATAQTGAFGLAFRFMLATGQRRTEVGSLPWSEIDWKRRLWTIPQSRTKADRGHEIPLSDLALEILEACPKLPGSEFVFTTGRSARGDRGEFNVQPISGWGRAKERLDKLMLDAMLDAAEAAGETRKVKLPDWHLHDLRRTAATKARGIVTSRMTLARWIKTEGFPAPVQLGRNTVAWTRADVDEWIQGRTRGRGEAA